MENSKTSSPMTVRVPIGARVAENIARSRQARGLSQSDLVAKLREIGLNFAVSGISKIEKGQRKMDPDDLVGFAIALDTTPNALLFGTPFYLGPEPLALTELRSWPANKVWSWATGDYPLEGGTGKAIYGFQQTSRPHEPTALPVEVPKRIREMPQIKALEDAYKEAAALTESDRRVLDAVMAELRQEQQPPFDLDGWLEESKKPENHGPANA